MPRRNITISLDDAFIAHMDTERGDTPRSRWLEGHERVTANTTPRQEAGRAQAFRKATQPRPIIQKRGKT